MPTCILILTLALLLIAGDGPDPLPAGPGPLLIVAPHPDDETLGCGGLIARATRAGRRVEVVVLTDGRALLLRQGITENPSPGQVAEQRKEESRRAVAILGPGVPIRFLDFENERLVEQRAAAVAMLEELLRKAQPAAVYVTSPFEGHPEHVVANAVVREACGRSGACPRIVEYVVSLKRDVSLEQLPRKVHRLDISADLERKREAVGQFRAHLDRLSPKQARPLWISIDRYTQSEEVFLFEP